jgi:hypothetical protein
MGAVILFAALSLVLSVLTPMIAPLLAQTPFLPPHPEAFATAVLSPMGPELALLPDAPIPAAAAISVVLAPCQDSSASKSNSDGDSTEPTRKPCLEAPTSYSPFLNSTAPAPLTRTQKALLAFHDFEDPANLTSVAYSSAYTIGTDSHTAYGPGWKGFGENFGYRLVRDATGEFVGTFLIPSLTHQDPRYHRMPDASISRRVLHAVSHTVIAQSDTGAPMPNYATLVGTPIRAEIANLYIPGVQCNLPDTSERVLTSFATHPIDDLVTEFLPDLAKHVHLHVLFAQRLFNEMSGTR